MMRLATAPAAALAFLLASAGFGQSVGKRKVALSDEVASMTDASQAFARMERALGRVVGIDLALTRMPAGDPPVSRVAVIGRFAQVFEALLPRVRFMPRPQPLPPEGLSLPVGHPNRAQLERLIRWGLVSSTSSLATSKSDSISVAELGDAIGYFMLRVADLTHRPDPKFSPILGGSG